MESRTGWVWHNSENYFVVIPRSEYFYEKLYRKRFNQKFEPPQLDFCGISYDFSKFGEKSVNFMSYANLRLNGTNVINRNSKG